jgi:hypothetical protein
MANEEGVKIIITAEDRFSETMKKIDASSKIFGETTKNTQKNLEALEKEMVRLVANGLDPADKKIKEMKANYDKLNQSLNGNNNSIKKSNQQWTNFALVIQDLPYGFRGIQNNLPAVLGGIAGMAGPLYLAGSAIIALFTAWDAGLFKTKNATDELKKSQEEFNKSLKSSLESGYTEISSIKALIAVAKDHTTSMENRLLAVKKLQNEYPAYFGNLSQEKILNGDLSSAINGVSNALLARAEATALEGKIGVLATEKLANEEKLFQLAIEKTKRLKSHKEYLASPFVSEKQRKEDAKKNMVGIMLLDIRTKEGEITKRNLDIQKESLSIQEKINKLTVVALPLETQKTKDVKAKKEKENIFNILSYTQDYYQAKMNYADGDLEQQKQILKEEGNAYLSLFGLKIISDIEYAKKSSEVFKKLSDIKQTEEKKLLDAQIKFANERVKNIETQSNVELKLAKGNIQRQQEAIQKAMVKTSVLALTAFNPAVLAIYLNELDNLKAKLDGIGEYWDKTSKQINDSINNFLVSSFVTLGESIGQALAGDNVDILNSFGMLLADALISIGKSLIEYATMVGIATALFADPLTWPIALATGIAAVAAGTLLKSSLTKHKKTETKAFANGGIVSGPTYGLMGEYPGAKSNPEVVAPLDKLKSMIGGGGSGEFVLRGNDLVLALQRSNSSLTLRR